MIIQGTYCEGSQCKKRDKCALHCVQPGDYEYIDWSTYGGGHAWSDKNGTHVETWYDCGDNGDYKKFKPILKINNKQELIDDINDIFRTHYEATMNTEFVSPEIRQCERFVINELWHDVVKVLKQFEETQV